MLQYFQVRKIKHDTVTTVSNRPRSFFTVIIGNVQRLNLCIYLYMYHSSINFCGVTLVQYVCSCKSQNLYYYRRGTPRWHSTGSHSHLSTWAGSSLLLSGSSGDHLQCCLPPVQLCVQKQKVITKLVYIGIYTFSVHTLHHVVSHCSLLTFAQEYTPSLNSIATKPTAKQIVAAACDVGDFNK